jgi:GTP-binding protein YchF
MEKALPRLEKEFKRDATLASKLDVARRLNAWMEQGHRARTMEMTDAEQESVRDLHLLTMKPMLYIANVDEDSVTADLPAIDGIRPLPICAKVESELADLEPEEASAYLAELGLAEPGLNALITRAYELLGLMSYFTAGVQEVRAWTVRRGAKAPEAAGVIHTDFEKGFIKAETIAYADFDQLGGEAPAKTAGKLRIEGKDYTVQDGDVMHFRFNV